MSLFNGQLARDWAGGITPNLRRTFASVLDAAGWFIYENTQRLSTKWTRVWESDGVAGPANDSDNTQRLVSVAASSVRGANTTTAQSWGMYKDSNNVQILIAFTGASDDIIRLAYSPGGLYVRAGTATFPPTASDEVVISNGNTIVNATASLDRTMTIWCVDKDWRCVVFRNGAIVRVMAIQMCISLAGDGIFGIGVSGHPPYIGGQHTNTGRTAQTGVGFCGPPISTANGSAGFQGMVARVFTSGTSRVTRLGAGEISHTRASGALNNNSMVYASATDGSPTDTPAAQGSKPPLLPIVWSGERAANLDGYWAVPIDWWFGMMGNTGTPTLNDFMPGFDPADTPGITTPRTNWLMSLGPTCVWPWRNVAASLDVGL